MGAISDNVGTAGVLLGKVRRSVLALLFCNSPKSFYLRQIARTLRLGNGAVQRELARLTDAGLVLRQRQGRQVYYQANRESAVFDEIRSLMIKTTGLADVLRGALADLEDRVTVAFVYGSFARGTDKADSDVDVAVIGDVTFAETVDALDSAQKVLAREVNPTVMSPGEYVRRMEAGDHFAVAISQGPYIFLIGGERELAGLGHKRLAGRTPDERA